MKGFKRTAALILTAVLVFLGPSAFAYGTETTAASGEKQIQILQSSDIHGMFLPFTYATLTEHPTGSLAQIATVIKERRNKNTLVIDVGDTIQGNSNFIFNDAKLHPTVVGMNQIGYDYWVAGNHEFDFGVPLLKNVAKQFAGTFLCGNVFEGDNPIGAVYDIKEIDGVRVATIGMVSPNITYWDRDQLSPYGVSDPLDDLKDILAEVKNKADVILLAYHVDKEKSIGLPGSSALDIAEAYPEIDVILAAHGHRIVNDTVNGVLVTENKDQGVSLCDIDITVEPDGKGGYKVKDKAAEMILLEGVAPDEKLSEELKPYDEAARKDAEIPIAELVGGDLVPPAEISGITQAQIQENSMQYLINSALRYYANADISAVAIASRDANIHEGTIRKCDVAEIYKYDDTVYKLEMTGKQLKTYMEWAAEYYNTLKEGDLTISFDPDKRYYNNDAFLGVNYKINISKEPGNRIEDLTLEDGRELKDDDTVTIAVSNYRATSHLLTYGPVYSEEKGDTLPKLLDKEVHAGAPIRELIVLWFTEDHYHGIVTPDRAYNWELTGIAWDEKLHEKAAELINAGIVELPWSEDGLSPNARSVTVDDIRASFKAKGMKKKIRVSIEPLAGADHYIIRYAANKKMKKAKSVETTEPETVLKKLKANKTYYIEVTAVSKKEGEEHFFAPSAVQKVKVGK